MTEDVRQICQGHSDTAFTRPNGEQVCINCVPTVNEWCLFDCIQEAIEERAQGLLGDAYSVTDNIQQDFSVDFYAENDWASGQLWELRKFDLMGWARKWVDDHWNEIAWHFIMTR